MIKKDIIKRRKGEVIQEAKLEQNHNFSTQRNKILVFISLFLLFFFY